MKIHILTALLIVSLTACRAPTLEERLAGKTGGEREGELYDACLETAHYPVPGGHPNGHVGHEIRMWAICDAMHKTNTTEGK